MKNLKLTLTFGLLLTFSMSFSQTKWIFHKSHSGKNATLNLDLNNNFGPGMSIDRYRIKQPLSPIKLQYITEVTINYPIVILDTAKKNMRFFDTKDSIIGCIRNYNEYLREGTIVFDIITNEYFVYQKYANSKKTEVFFPVTDSIKKWELNKDIYVDNSYILDGKRRRIFIKYPNFNYKKTRKLKRENFIINPNDIIPTKINTKKIKRENRRLDKEEKKAQKTETVIKNLNQLNQKEAQKDNAIPIFNSINFPPKSPSKMPLYLIGLLVLFSLFFWIRKVAKTELLKT